MEAVGSTITPCANSKASAPCDATVKIEKKKEQKRYSGHLRLRCLLAQLIITPPQPTGSRKWFVGLGHLGPVRV